MMDAGALCGDWLWLPHVAGVVRLDVHAPDRQLRGDVLEKVARTRNDVGRFSRFFSASLARSMRLEGGRQRESPTAGSFRCLLAEGGGVVRLPCVTHDKRNYWLNCWPNC
jgi:hypothetical protein